jgi:hypothetical protein
MDTLQELNELREVKRMIESDLFQKYFAKPLRDREDEIKNNFFSDSLRESWRKGGRKEGIEEFFKILKQINREYKNKKFDITDSE